jgi:hypothetical protein
MLGKLISRSKYTVRMCSHALAYSTVSGRLDSGGRYRFVSMVEAQGKQDAHAGDKCAIAGPRTDAVGLVYCVNTISHWRCSRRCMYQAKT